MTLTPYINLSGNAEEVLNFYQGILGGTTEIMRWEDIPPDPHMPITEEWKSKIMHATLNIKDGIRLFLSDSITDQAEKINTNIFIHIEFDTEDELRKAYETLSEEGTINMPLEKQFWGAIYGDLIDKYGTGWGLHFTPEE